MVIDLNKCVGCGTCGFACKAENNTQNTSYDRSYNWASFLTLTHGKFPNTKYSNYPVLCNHCSDAPCIENCPATPKALYKTADGITMTINDNCIGCQTCVGVCPYSAVDIKQDEVQYSVVNLNPTGEKTHPFWDDSTPFIADGTSNPTEVHTKAGFLPPYGNDYTHKDYRAVRKAGVVEKCIFCDHRVSNGDDPNCVDRCPSGARTFGDKDDPGSEVSKLLAMYQYRSLKSNNGEFLGKLEAGTEPNVYYIRDTSNPTVSVEESEIVADNSLKIYPNPAVSLFTIETVINKAGSLNVSIYNIQGKEVRKVVSNKFIFIGKHSFKVNASDLKPGTYICRVQCGRDIKSSNVIITK